MYLSLAVLIGSVFMFVFASFAWLQISEVVNIANLSGNISDIETPAILYVYTEGEGYTESESLNLGSGAPGNVYFFQVVITNDGDVSVSTRVLFTGFLTSMTDPNGVDTGYLAGYSLVDVIRITTSNNVDSQAIDDELMINLLPSGTGGDFSESTLTLMDPITLGVGESVTLNVTLVLDGETSNDYQNLSLQIGSIAVQSVTE